MNTQNICILIAIVVYLVLTVAIGVMFSKRNKTTDDFYLGGRKLGPFVTAMSAEASDMSSWLLMGLPGVAYLSGTCEAAWTAIGLAVGTYVNWLIVSKRLRCYSQQISAATIPDFFSNRYKDQKNLLLVFAAIVIIIFFVPYTASGFSACGKLFESLFGLDYHIAMIVSAFIIVFYTTLGGFLAASTSDFMQSIVMTLAIFIVLGFGIASVGGMGEVINNAKSLSGYLSLNEVHNAAGGTEPYNLLTIFSKLSWGLGYFGMPHILLRFMAIEDTKKLKLSRRIATVWVVISLTVAILIGVIGNAMTKNNVIPALEDAERIIIEIAKKIAEGGIVPALIAGVILAGILAATMSTADSQLLAASSSVSQNIVKTLFIKKLDDKQSMVIARITVLIISLIAIVIAWDPNSSVFEIVSFAWAGFGAAFGPAILAALFWKRSNFYGTLAGMISGGIAVFVWKFIIAPMGGILNIYELLPAFVISAVVIIAVSLLTKEPDKDIVEEFEVVSSKINLR